MDKSENCGELIRINLEKTNIFILKNNYTYK